MAETMNFFRAQGEARGRTSRLIVLLAIAVIALISGLYFFAVLAKARFHLQDANWWQPELFLLTSGVAALVIAGGSFIRIMELSQGGIAVAKSLGCRIVTGKSSDSLERRYVNIVQEMALASNLPVPICCIIDQDDNINAFAAGNTPQDAVVGVTQGALVRLTRDELQGVIAHEFSHIGNGDMRLNLRIIGLIAGLLALTNLGYILMRCGSLQGGDRKKGNGQMFVLAGIAMLIAGLGGMLFARIIQAAVSRQREFLADASAVQFTRNPIGLAGALTKVQLISNAPQENNEYKESFEMQHLFFSSTPNFFNSIFSTHPPLSERIDRISPSFNKTADYQRIRQSNKEWAQPNLMRASAPDVDSVPELPRASLSEITRVAAEPTNLEIQEAVIFDGQIPSALRHAADEPIGAMALVFSLILASSGETRSRQLQAISPIAGGEVVRQIGILETVLRRLPPGCRVPILDLAMPSIRQLSTAQIAQFSSILHQTGSSLDDGLLAMLIEASMRRYLKQSIGAAKTTSTSVGGLADVSRVLSAVVATSSASKENRLLAYSRGMESLKLEAHLAPMDEAALGNLALVRKSLDSILALNVNERRKFVRACGIAILHDGRAEPAEVEIVRAVADSLGITFATGIET